MMIMKMLIRAILFILEIALSTLNELRMKNENMLLYISLMLNFNSNHKKRDKFVSFLLWGRNIHLKYCIALIFILEMVLPSVSSCLKYHIMLQNISNLFSQYPQLLILLALGWYIGAYWRNNNGNYQKI